MPLKFRKDSSLLPLPSLRFKPNRQQYLAATRRLHRSQRHSKQRLNSLVSVVLPDAPIALLALASLFPGWIFIRLAERRAPRPERSGFAELVELAAVGFSTVGLSALIVAGLSWTRLPGLFNVRIWARLRGNYLGQHIGFALLSMALVAGLSCILAVGLFFAIYKFQSKGIHPESTVWYDALGRTPEGKHAWVGVQCADDSLVEGFLFSYSYSDEDAAGIALQGPMRLTRPGEKAGDLALDRVIIPGDQIRAISVLHVSF
jgi:hypothetical protein